MDWMQVDIFTTTEGIEPVGAALLELGVGGYAVQDAADFEEFLAGKTGRWDYLDEDLMRLRDAETKLTVYLTDGAQGVEQLASLKDALARLRALDEPRAWGRLALELTGVREEDWENAWKQYYQPIKIGGRLVVCPSWEDYATTPEEVVIRLDPGMAFGTGGHDSTQLCMRLLETHMKPSAQVLDMGCGSGVLSVAALLLGARSALGVDIDEVAVRVANENAERNGVADQAVFVCGDLADKVERGAAFDLVFANIVADVIVSFLPDVKHLLAPGGAFIASGIIDTREQDVRDALDDFGLAVVERLASGGWIALCCRWPD